jgi:phosphocarrier protein
MVTMTGKMEIPDNVKRVSRQFVIQNRLGVHSRPAAMFAKFANRFKAEIIVEKDGDKADGKDSWAFQNLVLGPGAKFTIHAVGVDADQAIEELTVLVNRGFDED